MEWIESLAQHPKVIGIGEMGLDYITWINLLQIFKGSFRKQIALACSVKVTGSVHDR
ncbi:TatD family hydrolase [Staphylococcus aureus]